MRNDADLTAFTGTLSGIEQIDLQSDTGANSLTLTAQDVLDLSDTDTLTVPDCVSADLQRVVAVRDYIEGS